MNGESYEEQVRTSPKEDEMKTVMLEIEDGKFDQFMTVINSLKSDMVRKFEVQKKMMSLQSMKSIVWRF